MNIKKYDGIIIIVGIIMIFLALFMPKSGNLALFDVAMDTIICWGIVLLIAIGLKENRGKKKKVIAIIVGVLFLGFSLWTTKNIVMDFFLGPKKVTLYHTKMSESKGRRGIISQHYYIEGYDSIGNKYKLEVSADEYWNTNLTNEVVVLYYENTKRLYAFGGLDE